MGIDCTATTAAAIANRIEAIQHGILEKGVMHVTAFLFCMQDFHSLFLCDPPGPPRVVFDDKAYEGFTNHKTDIEGQTGIGTDDAAGAIEYSKVIRIVQYDIPGAGIRNNPFQIGQPDLFVHGNELRGRLQRHDLSVIAISERILIVQFGQQHTGQPAQWAAEDAVQRMVSRTDADVKIGPASIDIPMQPVYQGMPRCAAGLFNKSSR